MKCIFIANLQLTPLSYDFSVSSSRQLIYFLFRTHGVTLIILCTGRRRTIYRLLFIMPSAQMSVYRYPQIVYYNGHKIPRAYLIAILLRRSGIKPIFDYTFKWRFFKGLLVFLFHDGSSLKSTWVYPEIIYILSIA